MGNVHTLYSGQSLAMGAHGEPAVSTVSEATNAQQVDEGGVLTDLEAKSGNQDGQPGLWQRPELSMGYRIAEAHPGEPRVFSTHAWGGRTIAQLSKGGPEQKFEQAIQRVTDNLSLNGSPVLVDALHWTQGEADMAKGTSRTSYLDSLDQLQVDYSTDIAAVTGQSGTIPIICSQVASWPEYGSAPTVGLYQLEAHRTRPEVFLAGPQYQFAYSYDAIHMTSVGYYHLGEVHARAHLAALDGGWDPVAPTAIAVDGTSIVLEFTVPTPPLVFDTTLIAEQPNMGFSLHGTTATITGVAITGPSQVTITTDQEVTEQGSQVGYGAAQWQGNLRDSDPSVSEHDGAAIPNWSVQFVDPLIGASIDPLPDQIWRVTGAYVATEGGLFRLTRGAPLDSSGE